MTDNINDIVETLIFNTKNGNLIWEEKPGAEESSRNHKRYMFSIGEDGSIFEITLEYKLSINSWILELDPCLWIKNEKLPDGRLYVSGSKFDTNSLQNIIKELYCQDLNPKIEDVKDTLDNIAKGISLSCYRNNKIDKILKI